MYGKIAEPEDGEELRIAVRKDRYVSWVNSGRLLR
jgi:hypothetical protein